MYLIIAMVTLSALVGIAVYNQNTKITYRRNKAASDGLGVFAAGVLISAVIFGCAVFIASDEIEDFQKRDKVPYELARQNDAGDPCSWDIILEDDELESEDCDNFKVLVVDSEEETGLVIEDDLSGGMKDWWAVVPGQPRYTLYVTAEEFNEANN
jgi:hypothetical protein